MSYRFEQFGPCQVCGGGGKVWRDMVTGDTTQVQADGTCRAVVMGHARVVDCDWCHGLGVAPRRCQRCNGRGRVMDTDSPPQGILGRRLLRTCLACNGTGQKGALHG